MRRLCTALRVWICVSASWLAVAQNLVINPTTTLSAQTSNNTSAADSFQTLSNGDEGATNVSKMDIHSLLYPGATTPVYAHYMPWFGNGNHMDVGYSSTDPAQVHRQIVDMISRGINGVIIDWYGPGSYEDSSTQLVKAEAETHPGFVFAIMVDVGAIQYHSCSGCDPQQALTADLQYIEQNYFPSPAYMLWGGAPAVTEFAIDDVYTIDWVALQSSLSSNPIFFFQNSGGFSHPISGGGYSWVMPTTTDLGVSYLTDFYGTGASVPQETTVGATYKGFNDTLASWGSNRIMPQGCGQTWLQTFSLINSLYNSSDPLNRLQLVTWNDYEEATEIESGIDNCVGISANVASDTLQWSISGSESTIDHYTVYISLDGQDLMPLTDLATGLYSLDLCSYSPAPGAYTLYVQAIGKPSIRNQMSGPVTYNPQCVAPTPVSVTISPGSASLAAGGSQQFTATVAGTSNTAVSWSASGGSISGSGLYTAPGAAGAYTVTATSAADNTKFASAVVTVTVPLPVSPPPVAASVSPSSLTVSASSQSLTVNGSGFQSGALVGVAAPGSTVSWVSPTSVTASAIQAAVVLNQSGAWLISVQNPDGNTSGSLTLNVAAAVPPVASASSFAVNLSPASINVSSGHPGSAQISVNPVSGAFNSVVSLSCSNLPAGMTCAFSPATVSPGSAGASSTLTVSFAPLAALSSGGTRRSRIPFNAGFGLSCAFGLVFAGGLGRKRVWQVLLGSAAVGVLLMLSSCGAANMSNTVASATSASTSSTYNIIVNGQSGAVQVSTAVAVTVQ